MQRIVAGTRRGKGKNVLHDNGEHGFQNHSEAVKLAGECYFTQPRHQEQAGDGARYADEAEKRDTDLRAPHQMPHETSPQLGALRTFVCHVKASYEARGGEHLDERDADEIASL